MILGERYDKVKAGLPAQVTLVAVSKTRTVVEIQALYDLGHRDFGENYVQELRAKQQLLPSDIRWHFIGHLQRSNVKHIAPFIHLVHGVDGAPLLDELEKRATSADRTINALLQVHIAQEETKHGLSVAETEMLIAKWDKSRWSHVCLRGLMGMATNTTNEVQVSSEFGHVGALFRSIRSQGQLDPAIFDTLSMGMSGDAQLAIAAGSNMVRIGTAIFGERA